MARDRSTKPEASTAVGTAHMKLFTQGIWQPAERLIAERVKSGHYQSADEGVFRDTSQIVIVPQTTLLFERALKRYQDMSDKSWSLTDCSSFLIMEEERLASALTHDRHFAQAGLQTLLR